MPIFSRRRLQQMLLELAGDLTEEKSKDLVRRLEDKRPEQSLPAEMELALLWAIAQRGEVDIEPFWWGEGQCPDAYTESLVPGTGAAIEIVAVCDNRIAGNVAMDRIAQQITILANQTKKGAGSKLYFRFGETSGYEKGGYFRRRLAPEQHELSSVAKELVRSWVREGESGPPKLMIKDQGLAVEVERTAYRQQTPFNVWCSMPPETHSVDENPLYESLERKLQQLAAAQPGMLRLIFLADAGSTLLNRLGTISERDPTGQRKSGMQILNHFVQQNSTKVDAVVMFSPRRKSYPPLSGDLSWKVAAFGAVTQEMDSHFQALANILPKPRFEGYQARSLAQQFAFSPRARGWYLGMKTVKHMEKFTVKISSRALLDLLAGRITEKQFRYFSGERDGDPNLFKHWLEMGMTLDNVTVEKAGLDGEDDYLVLHFHDDPAARPLLPSTFESDRSR